MGASSFDDELERACEAMDANDQLYLQTVDPPMLAAWVLDVLGRIGPVAAWHLALREHRKRVEADTGLTLPDQSKWSGTRNDTWKEPGEH